MGDFEKKNSCKRLSEVKNCMQHKSNRKKFVHCCKKEKNVAKQFHHSGGLYKIPAKLQPFSYLATALNSGFGDAAELLLYMCNALLAYHKQ